MVDINRNSNGRNKSFLVKSGFRPLVTRAQAEHLQEELDHLAVLLDQVRRQTEKIEAAADAIGDALISELYVAAEGKNHRKSETGTKSNSRLRSVGGPIRPQGLERA